MSSNENTTQVNEVYNVFKDFFGEENTDLNITNREDTNTDNTEFCNIIVHFPKVTISNENNESLDVEDLWVQVPLTKEGKLFNLFTMTGTTFTIAQLEHNYCHSHIQGIPYKYEWKTPCLGTGPIKRTQYELLINNNLDKWELFCFELSLYVKTESLRGVPYRYLSNVNKKEHLTPILFSNLRTNIINNIPSNDKSILNSFIRYYIKKEDTPFSYNGSIFWFNKSISDCYIDISNSYIEWCNLVTSIPLSTKRSFLAIRVFKNNTLWKTETNNVSYYPFSSLEDVISRYPTISYFNFKGEPVHIKIKNNGYQEYNKVYGLGESAFNYIVVCIIKLLNATISSNGTEYII